MSTILQTRPALDPRPRPPPTARAARLLIVATDVDVARRLGDGLVAGGCAVSARMRASAFEARALLARDAFTLVLVDLNLHGNEAIGLIEDLRSHGTRAVALVGGGSDARLIEAIAAGARGAIAQQDSLTAARAVIEAVIAGQQDFSPAAAEILTAWIRRERAEPAPARATGTVELTARERDILSLAAAGHNYRRIAERLSCRPSTIYTHVRHIYEKLRVSCLPEALFQARQLNLLG